MFHIHVDADQISAPFEEFITDQMGFLRSDFERVNSEADAFQPNRHFTHKLDDGEAFQTVFDGVVNAAKSSGGLKGYIEGEWIAVDEDIPVKKFDDHVPIPFRLSRRVLAPSSFRESEIHIALNRNESDERLIMALRRMGFFVAYVKKPRGLYQILTAQGSRRQISDLLPAVRKFLIDAGGMAGGSIKEERTVRWWSSEPDLRMPPVIADITWT